MRVALGNSLEMYDFQIFGYYAPAIALAFFPSGSAFAGLMLSLMTFGAGFLMRPLGAVLLGAYIDHHGRRAGLMLTLALMAVGTLSIAVVPGYAAIGLAAPLLVVIGRLVQGLSAGVELGGVSVYLSEIATPGRKGFYVAWQSGSQQVSVMFAALLGILLSSTLSDSQLTRWGWRVPLLAGCSLLPLLFFLRRSLEETEAFRTRRHRPSVGMITSSLLHLAATGNLVVTLCVGALNFVLLPVSGGLSDRVGRRPVLLACTAVALVTAYPALSWLVDAPSFARLLAVELWLAAIYATYNGAMAVFLTEIMPVEVRTSGFSLAYSLATAMFGGFTPAICTYLIHLSGNRAIPGLWLSFAAICGLVAALVLSPKKHEKSQNL